MTRRKNNMKHNVRNFVETYDELVDGGLFTEEELNLVTNIMGSSIETLNDCIYARFGYHSIEQMLGEDEDDE
jgi:hypothetical protein